MKPDLSERDTNSAPMQTYAAATQQVRSERPVPAPDVIPTDALFQGRQEILIRHNGEHYRLRITKNAKLILTK